MISLRIFVKVKQLQPVVSQWIDLIHFFYLKLGFSSKKLPFYFTYSLKLS